MNGNGLLAICGKRTEEFHNLHRSKGRLWTAQPAFSCLEDPDQQDDDQNDQENGAKPNVHARLPPFGRALIVPWPSWGKTGKKLRLHPVLLSMTGKFVLRLGLVALFFVAFLGALTQLLGGRRPVLIGGSV